MNEPSANPDSNGEGAEEEDTGMPGWVKVLGGSLLILLLMFLILHFASSMGLHKP